ncbi:metal-sensitive transcriptional regulator [Microbacterium sp. YY-01]|uniref:metal-sensitive transcriptional regulator n=1 Tax=Microbacterium sp. YY-01 TaxID=3421634 RepID=UPI003D162CAF
MSLSDPDAARRRVINRLKRARGQLDAVITAVEDDSSCRDVITQLAAVTHALQRAGFVIVAETMKDCLESPDGTRTHDGLSTDELEKIFLTLA